MEHGMLNTGSQWSEREICAMIAEVKLPPGFGFASASFRIIQALMLAGFCLLFGITPALSEEIFKPTGRYAQPAKSGRYLVKFTGDHCPPCKTWDANELPKLKAAGFTPTIVDSTHGNTWGVTSLPTFWIVDRATGKPVEKATGYTSAAELIQVLTERSACEPAEVVPQLTTMTHSEMVGIHNSLHGGGSWNWPGDLGDHLRTVHGVSTEKCHPVNSRPSRVQQSACPGGNCLSPTNRAQRRGGFLRGLFGG